MVMKLLRFFLALLLLPLLHQTGHATDAPRLVVFISIDQMRADHLER